MKAEVTLCLISTQWKGKWELGGLVRAEAKAFSHYADGESRFRSGNSDAIFVRH